MNDRIRRFIIIAVITIVCSSLLLPVCVFAASEKYTYTVRVFAGAQGTIKGEAVAVYTGIRYGERFTFDVNDIEIVNEKYYPRGIRESGRDNNTVGAPSFIVTRDVDYIVAYGIRGDQVAYTVSYTDEDGNELSPSVTYYGNIGDRPVVAYLYFDGYLPQYYNLTGTLSENEAENVFNFVYVREAEINESTAPENPVETDRTESTITPSETDENGNVITPVETDENGNVITPVETDENGNVITPVETDENGNVITPVETDENGNVITPVETDENGNVITPSETDENGNVINTGDTDESGTNETGEDTESDESDRVVTEEIGEGPVPQVTPNNPSNTNGIFDRFKGTFSQMSGLEIAFFSIGTIGITSATVFLIWLLIVSRKKKNENE